MVSPIELPTDRIINKLIILQYGGDLESLCYVENKVSESQYKLYIFTEERRITVDFLNGEHIFYVVVNPLTVIPKTLHKKQILLYDGEYKCEHGSLEYFEINPDDEKNEENPSTPKKKTQSKTTTTTDKDLSNNKNKKSDDKDGNVSPEAVDKTRFIFWNDYGECV